MTDQRSLRSARQKISGSDASIILRPYLKVRQTELARSCDGAPKFGVVGLTSDERRRYGAIASSGMVTSHGVIRSIAWVCQYVDTLDLFSDPVALRRFEDLLSTRHRV